MLQMLPAQSSSPSLRAWGTQGAAARSWEEAGAGAGAGNGRGGEGSRGEGMQGITGGVASRRLACFSVRALT